MKFRRKLSNDFDKSFKSSAFWDGIVICLFFVLTIIVPDEWVNRVIAFILLYYFAIIKDDLMFIVYSDYEEYEEDNE